MEKVLKIVTTGDETSDAEYWQKKVYQNVWKQSNF